MQKLFTLLLVILCSGLITSFVAPVSSTFASSAPTRFSIPNTSLTIKGFASPNAFVQIFDGSSLIGTLVADSNGVFEKNFPSMTSGLKNIRLQYDDIDSTSSDTLSQNINVRPQADTAIEYFLPPTLRVSDERVEEGGRITFSGSTIPNATVEIILDGGNLILKPQSGPDGRYSITIDTADYYFGEHAVVATATQGGLTSFQTNKKTFLVVPVGQSENDDNSQDGELQPPVITVTDGKIETDQEIQLIRGTARPNTQIIVYQDGEPVGSTFSNEEGHWFYNVSISAASHSIKAIACSVNECSDFSNEVTITFVGDFTKCSNFRIFIAEYRFWGVNKDNGVNLPVTGLSGTPSYEILVDWGDAVAERFNRNSASSFDIHHIYTEIGQYNGTITVVDEAGCEHSRYFSVDVVDNDTLIASWMLWTLPMVLVAFYFILRHRRLVRRKQLRLAR